MTGLTEAIARFRPFNAIVVGDVMLDELLYGDADRLSQDAPVPVLRVRRSDHRAGGTANVCLDLAALGGRVSVLAVVGDDPEAGKLREAMERNGIVTDGVVVDPSRPTTVKRSLIGLAQHRHPQKMFRVDFESREAISDAVRGTLLEAFDAQLASADVVCIEDYDKGVCSEAFCQAIIERARAAGKPVLVDPAAIEDYSKYRGATCITPNRTEAERATATALNEDRPEANADIAAALLDRHRFDTVVLTLDRHGAMLVRKGETPVLIPTVAREVYDVTGAGDMVLAGLAASIACGLEWEQAVGVANAAAGLEVEIFGVEPIPLDTLRHAIMKQDGKLQGKLRTLEQVLVEAGETRKAGGAVVFTNGCFDIIHTGHVTLLERAAELGAMLIVGLNTDASIARLKGPDRPVNTLEDRARVLGATCITPNRTEAERATATALNEDRPEANADIAAALL
ncbi:MAG: PfkB family carbohydrate kinase, partial [Planctomycetota bacterium]